jgi:putative DNA primase/helicase
MNTNQLLDDDVSFDFTATPAEPTSPALETALQTLATTVEGPPDADILLATVRGFITRYCILSKAQATICAAWVLHTWTIKAFNKTPYLLIQAAERSCGKSTLLDAMAQLAYEPLSAGAATGAALTRALHQRPCTLFLDEIDLLFSGDTETASAVAGVLNCGYQRGKPFLKCDGKDNQMREFNTFGAKALSGIAGNKLPESTISRCVPIEMRRKLRSEKVQRFVERDYSEPAGSIRAKLKAWATLETVEAVKLLEPELIDVLSDRENDAIEPLLQIAELAGDVWPHDIRAALVEVFQRAKENDTRSTGESLLQDIRDVFEDKRLEKISSHDLITALCEMDESPWNEWNRGKPLSPRQLGNRLQRFGIKPQVTRFADGLSRGYRKADFAESWTRYLQNDTETASKSGF